MCKRIVLVAAVLFAACGTEHSSPPASPDQPSGPGPTASPGTGVPLPGLHADTTRAKVIVRRNGVQQVQAYDDNGDPIPGQFYDLFTELFRYVKNIDNPLASGQTIQIPYGNDYTIEVVEFGVEVNGVRPILADSTSALFNVNGTTTVNPVYPPRTFQPTMVLSPVYVGLDAPFNVYTVTVAGPSYPLSTRANSWSVLCGGAAPLVVRGSTLTFPAPSSDAGFDCIGTFHLDSALNTVSGETATYYSLAVTQAVTPIPSGTVGLPP